MIKNITMRISVDPRGKIKAGRKSEKGLPQSLDHFNVDKFPELQAVYGIKPKTMVLFFPSNRITDIFDCNYVNYARAEGKEEGTKIRSCDGEHCTHRITETINGKTYEVGSESECICPLLPETIQRGNKEVPNPKRCKYTMWLKAFIALPTTGRVENPLCYMFESSSKNSGDGIYSELEKVLVLTGGKLIGVPFAISVTMISGKKSASQKFPIISLKPIGMVSDIKKITGMEFDPMLISGDTMSHPVKKLPEARTTNGDGMTNAIISAKNIRQLEALEASIKSHLTSGSMTQEQVSEYLRKVESRKQDMKGAPNE